MRHRLSGLACVMAAVAAPACAQQVAPTYVSGKGVDSGPCSRAAPCRSFQYALSQTSAGGTLVALDSAGYGSVNIQRAVTISAPPGIVAIASATATRYAIFVGNAVGFSVEGLTLDGGLYVDSVPVGTPSAGSVTRCMIRSGDIEFANTGGITITDSTIADNVALAPGRGIGVQASILRSTVGGSVSARPTMDFVTYGETTVTDSAIGSFSSYGLLSTSYTVRLTRSNARSVSIGERDIAYLSGSSIDSLSIDSQAIARGDGTNDIISVSGAIQSSVQN